MPAVVTRTLIALPFALFLLLFPLFSGQPILGWNVAAAVLFVVVFLVSQTLWDRRRARPRRDTR